MSDSTELRRMLADRTRWPTAIYTLANHADALVALVEAVERIAELRQDGLHATMEYVDIMLPRLADVHAVKAQL